MNFENPPAAGRTGTTVNKRKYLTFNDGHDIIDTATLLKSKWEIGKGTESMKDIYISDIKTNQEIISYFIVKTIAVKVGSNKKAYLDLLLADRSGEISAKKWDIADEELPGLEKIKNKRN